MVFLHIEGSTRIDPCAQMFEGTYAPPFYTDLYNFKDGTKTCA